MKHLLLCTLLLVVSAAQADTTISPSLKYTYSASAGWINCRPDQPGAGQGLVVGEYFLSGRAYGANIGWLDFGDGTPADGVSYQNNSATDYGVNHDGTGNLTGMCYGANIGWVSFSWAAPNDPNRPRVNLATGAFVGYAYSGNLGWINLGTGTLTTTAMQIADSDNDGMADAWERTYFSNLTTATATTDSDKDGMSDLSEYMAGTAPDSAADTFHTAASVVNPATSQATITFTSDPTRLYRIEISGDLVTWMNSALGTFAPDPGLSTTRTVSWTGGPLQGSGKLFFQAVAVRPLSN